MRAVIPIPYVPNLNSEEVRLLQAVIDAHQHAARFNRNVSTVTFQQVCAGSGRLENGIIAAIASLGHLHGPILAARGLYENGQKEVVLAMLSRGEKIAGFGNSFHKTGIDPAWDDVMQIIRLSWPKIDERINELVSWMVEGGKPVYPNAALFTGAVCSALKIRGGTESSLFIQWRLPVWVDMMTAGWDKPQKAADKEKRIIG